MEFQEYTKTTGSIVVNVQPQFLPDRSHIEQGLYTYAYTVTIQNQGSQMVQLINRHWRVFSGERQIADVKGEGVVGEQPVIKPGDSFQYTSGTVVHHEVGSMRGYYTFLSARGEFFDVEIPEFHLIFLDSASIH